MVLNRIVQHLLWNPTLVNMTFVHLRREKAVVHQGDARRQRWRPKVELR